MTSDEKPGQMHFLPGRLGLGLLEPAQASKNEIISSGFNNYFRHLTYNHFFHLTNNLFFFVTQMKKPLFSDKLSNVANITYT